MGLVGSSPTLSSKKRNKMKKKEMKKREVLTGTFESSRTLLRQEPKSIKLRFKVVNKILKRLRK
jgi:hypothetical protein